MEPYAVLSDQHCHAWSAFSSILPDGRNSRLQTTLDEMVRAAKTLLIKGGSIMYFCGDLFHARGSINPEVFNPVYDTIKLITNLGVTIRAIPGNHDLKGRDTTELGNAIQTLGHLPGFSVFTKPKIYDVAGFAVVPWCRNNAALEAAVADLAINPDKESIDLFIHAGIDGVLSGMPASGLTPKLIASWGFRRVFAGHYHNHAVFEDGKVISVGATTHQKMSDIGTRAGFLIIDDKGVHFHSSQAPAFVEVNEDTDEDDIPLLVDGNFVRVRGRKLTQAQSVQFRDMLTGMGAVGVVFDAIAPTVAPRASLSRSTTATLESSIDSFVAETMKERPDVKRITAEALSCLSEARSVSSSL